MKELTIEQKAKAYDEAIKYGQYLINERCKEGTDGSFHRSDLQKMFPELRESEDEKTIKEIKQFIRSRGMSLAQSKVDSWLAWLEKQGKNNMGISEATKQELEDSLNKALEKETPESCNEFLEKKCEQKPADDIERKYDPCYNMSFEEAQEYISNRGFDIPWTDCDVFVDFRYVTQTIANILRWADDNPKQKPAWSEEDEEHIMAIDLSVNRCTGKWHCCGEKCPISEHSPWLKSLRPRSTWKPTKKQIIALRWVLNNVPYNKYKEEISGLLDQIKDL